MNGKFKVWDSKNEFFASPEKFFINHQGVLCDIFDGTETISKYITVFSTGQKDKQGRDIYEGDFLQCEYEHFNGVALVKKDPCNPRYFMKSLFTGLEEDDFDKAGLMIIEIIGNKFENPELLEVV